MGRSHSTSGPKQQTGQPWIFVQLALILAVVWEFDLETRRYLFPMLCVAAVGIVVQAWLPARLRLAWFVCVSLAGLLFLLGAKNGGAVIGIGVGLIALCHVPLGLRYRVLLVAVAGLALAIGRVESPAPFWPVLGSYFMFRLIVYLFEMRSATDRPSLTETLAYFFLLPNACFALFPIVDFQTFRRTYRPEVPALIQQTGIAWIVRGLVHLLAYRAVKYYLLPAPHELRDAQHLALFLVANYALYLRVSGTFHLITGLLHLFGFNLPVTHDRYFFASSLTGIWRRINIYWKDFVAKVFFFPAFFGCRRCGVPTTWAMGFAVLAVFVATWLLHSWQTFWLLGELPLNGHDALLWLSAGIVVGGNLLWDLRHASQARAPAGFTWRLATIRALQILGTFITVSFFWACWTMPGFLRSVQSVIALEQDATHGLGVIAACLIGFVTIAVLAQFADDRLTRRGWLSRMSTNYSALAHVGLLVVVLVLAQPAVQSWLGSPLGKAIAALQHEDLTPFEAAPAVRGYYEELAEANLQAGPWLQALRGHTEGEDAGTHYSAMTRQTDMLLETELIPHWSGEFAGSPLTINEWGLRDRAGIPQQKPADSVRIAVVGSSVVMGYGVRDDEVFPRLLEERLNSGRPDRESRLEFLNFGIGRYTVIQRRVLLHRKVFGFEPDAVWYVAHQDEFLGSVEHLTKLVAHRTELPYPELNAILKRAQVGPETAWGMVQVQLQPFAADIVAVMYRGIVADCRARQVLPVWIYLPMPGIADAPAPSAELQRLAQDAGFVVLDLTDWSAGRNPRDVKLSSADHHANAAGHRLIAERLAHLLTERPDALPSVAELLKEPRTK